MIKSGILVPSTASITQKKSIFFPLFLAETIPRIRPMDTAITRARIPRSAENGKVSPIISFTVLFVYFME